MEEKKKNMETSGLLDKITKANDIKNIPAKEYAALAEEIRQFLISNISKTGGHLASNLGVVELTMALHLSLDLPTDKLVWDVGHQSYTHKILTGRKEGFRNLRMYEGLCGFPKRRESDCDAFDTGHSSTSISAALGLAKARDLQREKYNVVAVIGDGALSGGMAYEALNNAARLKSNMIIILNDNNMSISENVGGMATYLGKIRTSVKYNGFKDGIEKALSSLPKGKTVVDRLRRSKDSIKRLFIPGMLFEDMGLTYIGPIDGHNIEQLMTAIHSAKQMKEAVIIHVVTKKGKGYQLAEKNPAKYHGVDPFVIETGVVKKKSSMSYTETFSMKLLELAEANDKIVAITAAMPSGTGLTRFAKKYPKRFFDVGIAEEHAVTFAAGLAAGGMKPIVAIYSSFLQRAYDQIIHDVCISSLPVVFAIDRAGIVGSDGETHQGVFDISYLLTMPNMTVMAPKNGQELTNMLEFAVNHDGPVAIRYPRGKAYAGLEDYQTPIEYGKSELIYREEEILLLAFGSMTEVALQVRERLKSTGHKASLVNMRFVAPLDESLLKELLPSHKMVVTLEENVESGGFGQKIVGFLCKNNYNDNRCIRIALPDTFIPQGDVELLRKAYGLDAQAVVATILRQL
ncbi:1-deoxy-D-xylulose-5-phosphate synthase [Anaerosporobacter faecicola]|uniref:1-deoxy-D-xylulose-5-phosphate synthase n=1 Tax=Anaerosporobacter faecicola TaxID=2718714 RepID=UPI001EE4FB28|nr:1-deoxy-D-xylulose-5-phosphate synthase [Anaerosporobacter faecicola]